MERMTSGLSLPLGRPFGIPVRAHASLFLVLALFTFSRLGDGHRPLLLIAFLVAVFGCVLLHELGHALAARSCGIATREIVLHFFGGLAILERLPRGWQEVWITIAGPLVNLVLAIVLVATAIVGDFPLAAEGRLQAPGDLVALLALANLGLFVFNLLPAFPLDGGRLLRGALATAIGHVTATVIAVRLAQLVAVGLLALAIAQMQIVLGAIALFVLLQAASELARTRQIAPLLDHRAKSAMFGPLPLLDADERALDAAERLGTGAPLALVRDRGGKPLGLLRADMLRRALLTGESECAVGELVRGEAPSVTEETSLYRVIELLHVAPNGAVVVTRDGDVVGAVDAPAIDRHLKALRRAAAAADQR